MEFSAWRVTGGETSPGTTLLNQCCSCSAIPPSVSAIFTETLPRQLSSTSTSACGIRDYTKTFRYFILDFTVHREFLLSATSARLRIRSTFDQLADALGGSCKGKIIHFGCCGTLDWHGGLLNTFLKKTGACCVTGYHTKIGWVASAAFELFVFSALQKSTLTKASLRRVSTRIIGDSAGLAKKFGFRLLINPIL
jgi:hypothetical protein